MGSADSSTVTDLLLAWQQGEEGAGQMLIERVYPELHRLAECLLRHERPDHTLQPTALVAEVYLRLVDQRTSTWKNRAHFFALAAQAMRRILVDAARRRLYAKRGGGGLTLSLSHLPDLAEPAGAALVADLDSALVRFETLHPEKARLVELRFFGGLSTRETAEVLGVSLATVDRWWRYAKAWLFEELRAGDGAGTFTLACD